MAISKGVSIDARNQLETPDVGANLEVARLDNGGFVAIGDGADGLIQGAIFDDKGKLVADISDVLGRDGAVTQLSNGKILLAFDSEGDAVQYRTVDAETGEVGQLFLAGLSAEKVQVAAGSNGRAAFVYQKASVDDTDVHVDLFDKNNVKIFSVDVDTSDAKDSDATVAVLKNGAVAVAWTRTDQATGDTDVMYAIYDGETGAALKDPAVLAGDNDVNRDARIVATEDGFAVAYQGRVESDLSIDVVVKRFDLDGAETGFVNVSNRFLDLIGDDESDDADPYLSVGPDGNLLVSFTQTSIETGQTDPVVAVVDGTTLLQSVQANFNTSGKPQTGTASTFFGVGNIAVFDILKGSDAEGQRLTGFRDSAGDKNDNLIEGDTFEDLMNGLGGNDTLFGGQNDDELLGGGGGDSLAGGDGDDRLSGEGGADTLNGGAGNDTYFASQGATVVENRAGPAGGVDRVISFVDFTLGDNVENLRLSSASDRAGVGNGLDNKIDTRGAGSNDIKGLGGNDSLSGGDGDDTLDGGDGADRLNGGVGKDVVNGGKGADRLAGGADSDVFLFEAGKQGADLVTDFDVAADSFDLSGRAFVSMGLEGGDTTLVYGGGTIVVDGVRGLSLADWNDLVVG